jgi:hypothetical protein
VRRAAAARHHAEGTPLSHRNPQIHCALVDLFWFVSLHNFFPFSGRFKTRCLETLLPSLKTKEVVAGRLGISDTRV